MSIERISRINGEKNLLKDMDSNAVLYSSIDNHLQKRRNYLNKQEEDINNLKEEITEIKESISKIIEILSKENS